MLCLWNPLRCIVSYRGKLVFNEERLSEYARAVVWYIVKVGFEQKMVGKKIRLKSFVIDYKKYK